MLVELLIYMVEKGFVKNSQKLYMFMDIYDKTKANTAL